MKTPVDKDITTQELIDVHNAPARVAARLAGKKENAKEFRAYRNPAESVKFENERKFRNKARG